MSANRDNRKSRVPWLALACVSSAIYLIWRIFFTIPAGHGLLPLIAGAVLVLAEAAEALESFGNYYGAASAKEPELPAIPDSWFPDVDVLIATHNEPVELLFKTINGCKLLKYPDRDKVHIHLCDDGDRSEMRRLAKEMGVGYFGLKENREAKAGNLNHALSRTKSPLVATFDADMIPVSTFLMETVPYFFLPSMGKDEKGEWVARRGVGVKGAEERIGFIQTPQSFYNPDLFQYNLCAEKKAPNEQDYFFRKVNVRRNRTNTPIYAGSNTLISREALESVGGILTGTVTEDFATGIAIQAAGYTCYATGKPLAHGLSPTDMRSLIRQRQRWARGCVQTLRRREFLLGRLPLSGKLSYLQCLLYWWTFSRRLIYLASPILFTLFGIHMVDCSWWELALFWLPNHLISWKAMRLASGGGRSRRWSNLVDTAIFPFLILPVAAETVGIRQKRFAVTEKVKKTGRHPQWKYAAVHLLLMVGSIWGLYRCLFGAGMEKVLWERSILIYWLSVNLYYLGMAVRFLLGREDHRREERILAREKVGLMTSGGRVDGLTEDISESGMSVVTKHSHMIPDGQELQVIVRAGEYQAELKGRVARSVRVGDRLIYGIAFGDIPDEVREAYFGLIYDRRHIRIGEEA